MPRALKGFGVHAAWDEMVEGEWDPVTRAELAVRWGADGAGAVGRWSWWCRQLSNVFRQRRREKVGQCRRYMSSRKQSVCNKVVCNIRRETLDEHADSRGGQRVAVYFLQLGIMLPSGVAK